MTGAASCRPPRRSRPRCLAARNTAPCRSVAAPARCRARRRAGDLSLSSSTPKFKFARQDATRAREESAFYATSRHSKCGVPRVSVGAPWLAQRGGTWSAPNPRASCIASSRNTRSSNRCCRARPGAYGHPPDRRARHRTRQRSAARRGFRLRDHHVRHDPALTCP